MQTIGKKGCPEHQVTSAQSQGPMIFRINTQALEEVVAAVRLFLNSHLRRASCCGAACTGPYSPASFPGCDQVPQGSSSLSHRKWTPGLLSAGLTPADTRQWPVCLPAGCSGPWSPGHRHLQLTLLGPARGLPAAPQGGKTLPWMWPWFRHGWVRLPHSLAL